MISSNHNIRWLPTIQTSLLGRLVEELDAVGNGFIIMRMRRVIWTAWSLRWVERSIAVSLPWGHSGCRWWRWRRARTSRWERKYKAHQNLTEPVEKLHGWQVQLSSSSSRGTGGGGFKSLVAIIRYLYDKAVVVGLNLKVIAVHCILWFESSGKCNAIMDVVCFRG